MARKSKFVSPVKAANNTPNDINDEELLRSDDEHVNMGQDQSKERVDAQLDEGVAGYNEGRTRANDRVSTGKLTRPSKYTADPVKRDAVARNPGTKQRTLGRVNRQRDSAYDIVDEEPPIKLAPGKTALLDPLDGFSPMRKVRERAGKQKGDVSARPVLRSSPRRPARTQKEAEKEAEPVEASATQDEGRYRDLFPDPIVRQYGGSGGDDEEEGEEDEAEAAEFEAEEDDENVVVADREASSARKPTKSPAKRKSTQGRPTNASTSAAPVVLIQKKRLGRPPKNKHAAEPAQLSTAKETTTRKKRGIPAQAESEVVESTAMPARRRTRGQDSSTQPPQNEAETEDSRPGGVRKRPRDVSNDDNEDDDGDNDADDVNENSEEASGQAKATQPGATDEGAVDLFTQDYDDEESSEQRQPARSKSNKRARPPTKATANTSSKRRKPNATQEEPEAGGQDQATAHVEPTVSAADKKRVFGQWEQLEKIYKIADHIGRPVEGRGLTQTRSHKIDLLLEDEQVRATVKLCKKTITAFNKMTDDTSENDTREEPTDRLPRIRECIDGLCGKSDVFEYDERNVVRCTSIYFHLVPKLLVLLQSAIACYEEQDKDTAGPNKLAIDHLLVLNEIIDLLLDLIEGAADYFPRPDTADHVVQPVREIAPRLRDIHRVFKNKIAQHEYDQAVTLRAEAAAHQAALDLEEEEQHRAQQAEHNRIQSKWEDLHKVRYRAETGIPLLHKLIHLELPAFDIDANGRPFQRMELFHPRVGPPPGLVERASNLEWSNVELWALRDGLREYAGEYVFEKVFLRYCCARKELNRFNVTEVVVKAALLREWLIRYDTDHGVEVAEWIKGILVWINGQHALGKENEEEDGRDDVVV
ncbi:hypothetical protein LTR09_008202 [Extremus antarcticus]|uniref:Uncharacterized protein n=1 Tax=Extremus antarcticus TaxID=702011 RepID=A0AAJ0GAC5_9PEZI|nr:hypothetical protein LTR09_008202 [Extremus antarcticus]